VIHEAIIAKNAYPSPLNYMGFPKSVCTSINNIIAHGIPDNRPLEDGDIINVDVTVRIFIRCNEFIMLLIALYRFT
jgi:methionyl aminopeptidase